MPKFSADFANAFSFCEVFCKQPHLLLFPLLLRKFLSLFCNNIHILYCFCLLFSQNSTRFSVGIQDSRWRVKFTRYIAGGGRDMYFYLFFFPRAVWNLWSLTTGKNEKEYSWHVPAIKIIGMKQLVYKVAKILEKLRYLWKCEIWGNIVKIWYFVNATA